MAKWEWMKPPVDNGNCEQCKEPLRKLRDGGLVTYNGKHYHVHCLLDVLTEAVPAPVAVNELAGHPWGAYLP